MLCTVCGKETANPKFCSKSCAASFNNKLYPKRQKHCKKCNILVPPGRHYCVECHPHYRDWSKSTLAEQKQIRKYQPYSRIRELARTAYKNSSKPKECCNCGYKKHYEICHIAAINSFEDLTPISIINSLDNLVALCPNCHWELDNGYLTLVNSDFVEVEPKPSKRAREIWAVYDLRYISANAATASISTFTPRGKAATATQERAGR
ncbi:HNH endonuclease signature motif containing protein [Gloeobacter morelensis]|uniref:HNH endonuclease n=1 Tax=Gloeobacter morelensis MG652769 TaxID=2781736 RepID=A0ABY3PN38_9CYAN|nr:HNH endonuclease [Gloeobacter morelensis MG652769]